MPWSAPSICAFGGCQSLTVSGARYCATHVLTAQAAKVAARRDYNARRGTPASRGYDTNWRRSSRLYLAQNPVCNACGRLAECVDHRTPCDGSSPLFWSVENWQSMCRRCHSTKTAREDGGFGNVPRRGDV
jgi:5-methylcytosine-specific restriction protein A